MSVSNFSYLNSCERTAIKERVFDLLARHGVKIDPHPEIMEILQRSGALLHRNTGTVRFPPKVLENLISSAPSAFTLGARNPEKILRLPRPDGTFYARSCTGAHTWIDPNTGNYEKISVARLADWAKLINQLDEINFIPYLFPDDAPVASADIYALATLLKNTDKHIWVQPYSAESVSSLINLAATIVGGVGGLSKNPIISMIACSLTPRVYKYMDLEVIIKAAQSGIPIHACSLPGAGGTAPVTMLGTVLLAVAEIICMVAVSQAVEPGSPVVACPIIFATDMATGRSLQASVEAMRGSSLANQILKQEFNLPTHSYGSGSDSPTPDHQSMSERAMITTWMAASGLDILGGAGQLEVATAVCPLQLIVDNEVLGMARGLLNPFVVDDDQIAWQSLAEIEPGMHFLTTDHTLRHCRDAFKLKPDNFSRLTHDGFIKSGRKTLMERIKKRYRTIISKDNEAILSEELSAEIDSLVVASNKVLGT